MFHVKVGIYHLSVIYKVAAAQNSTPKVTIESQMKCHYSMTTIFMLYVYRTLCV